MTTCPDSSPRVGAGEPTGSPSKRLTTSGGPIRPSIIIPANTTVLMAVCVAMKGKPATEHFAEASRTGARL
jgi:hypothetical protein